MGRVMRSDHRRKGSDEELGSALAPGEPAMVIIAKPGEAGELAVGDGTFSEPGLYAVACFIPTGVDPDAYFTASEANPEGPPDIPNAGPPHATQGMYAEVEVW